MEDLIETVTRGNVAEVKTVLATVALVLGVYQVALAVVAYGKVKLPFLGTAPAARAHRFIGDSAVVIIVLVALVCLGYYGLGEASEETSYMVHAVAGFALIGLLAVKIVIIRSGNYSWGRILPFVGTGILLALAVVWTTVAPEIISGKIDD